ncbi:hypothetical protein KUTeg_016807 [Tegillarca granosa]|uniref:Protein kinase domain-containing protein n=1 Tax=Tegillarca granosa TaxID=220873 RepID=A0ABQ9ELY1_TEGGR|nr:hypothetical protein KUTeg_016807 [Tegillarca granosa]
MVTGNIRFLAIHSQAIRTAGWPNQEVFYFMISQPVSNDCCLVAIKILDTRKIKDGYMRENLHREANILGQLRHPNIIRLY